MPMSLQQQLAALNAGVAALEAIADADPRVQLVAAKAEAEAQRLMRQAAYAQPLPVRPLSTSLDVRVQAPPMTRALPARPLPQQQPQPPVGIVRQAAQATEVHARTPLRTATAAIETLTREQMHADARAAGRTGGQYYVGRDVAGMVPKAFAENPQQVQATRDMHNVPSSGADAGLVPIDYRTRDRLDASNPELMRRRAKLMSDAAASMQGGVQAPHGFSAPVNQSPYSPAALMKLAHSRMMKRARGR